MNHNSHWLDDDFKKINDYFSAYAKFVGTVNIENFGFKIKDQLAIATWNMFKKIPKINELLAENPEAFVKALNSCLKACLKKYQENNQPDLFSLYIYNTIPKMVRSAVNKDYIESNYITYSKDTAKKMLKVKNLYDKFLRCGLTDHSLIIRKISIILETSEEKIEKVYGKLINSKYLSMDCTDPETGDNYNRLDKGVSELNDYSSPENDFEKKEEMESLFKAINKNWLSIKQNKNETDSIYIKRKKMMSELLTVYVLKSFRDSYVQKSGLSFVAMSHSNFDISEAEKKYVFLDHNIVENFLSSEDKKLPTRVQIVHKHFPGIKEDAVYQSFNRFLKDIAKDVKNS